MKSRHLAAIGCTLAALSVQTLASAQEVQSVLPKPGDPCFTPDDVINGALQPTGRVTPNFLCKPTVTPAANSCRSVRDDRGYRAGYASGFDLVGRSFGILRQDCDQLERFTDLVIENVNRLSLPANASNNLACRYGGTADGVYAAIDSVFTFCSASCFAEGVAFGQVTAQFYCDLSIALGGLDSADDFIRGPVLLCGAEYEQGCDASYMDTSLNFLECAEYTQDPFTSVWDEFRDDQCAYNPEPN